MKIFGFNISREARSLENPSVSLSDGAAISAMFDGWAAKSASGVAVTIDSAMGIPAFGSAVGFLSNTLASLPMHVFETAEDGQKRVTGPMQGLLHDSPAEGWSSFAWRKYAFTQKFTGGRFVAFIEHNAAGRVINLWPLEPENLSVERRGGRKRYLYNDDGRRVVYDQDEVLDLTFDLKSDQVSHVSPVYQNKEALGQIIAIEGYASRFFANGGVPPLSLQGPFSTPAGIKRASDDVWNAITKANKGARNVLTMPLGHELKQIGFDPDKGQMVEARRFGVEQCARILSLPPVFIQDLVRATFTNSEQQDLHLVKHTVVHHVRQFEDELNLKLFGRFNRKRYVKMNLDGLLRGDFKTRMDGYATAIQNGIATPNEIRDLEDRPPKENGDDLMIQGATVPLGSQSVQPEGEPEIVDE